MFVKIAKYDLFTGEKYYYELEVENETIAKEFQWIEDQKEALREAVINGNKESLIKFYQSRECCIYFINSNSCSGCNIKDCALNGEHLHVNN
jgi:hypothetical protein